MKNKNDLMEISHFILKSFTYLICCIFMTTKIYQQNEFLQQIGGCTVLSWTSWRWLHLQIIKLQVINNIVNFLSVWKVGRMAIFERRICKWFQSGINASPVATANGCKTLHQGSWWKIGLVDDAFQSDPIFKKLLF